MPSSKTPVKIRLEPELAQKLHQLHPGYGEATRVVTELVTAYLYARSIKGSYDGMQFFNEKQAIEHTVKGRTA